MEESILRDLKAQLKLCTALVWVDGKPKGTAFFISDRALLTCEHVVKGHDEVDVQPFTRAARKAAVVAREPVAGLDLALLEVKPEAGEPQPCVLLDERVDDDDYYIAGYPREEGKEPGLEVIKLEGHARDAITGQVQQLQLEAGQQVTWGLSGGPVLSTATCAVTAVVRSSRDPQGALGGGAVPISKAAEAFEAVKQAIAEPPLAVRQWRDRLGKDMWQQLGRAWDMSARIDLRVLGARNRWCITTDPETAGQEYVTLDQLGDDVTEAMFRWAQRRRVSVTEEVELLGRLLAKAICPGAVASHFSTLGNADEVLVRLHIEPETELADIPWELAAVPNKAGTFLAADTQFRFVRVVDAARPAAAPPVETRPIRTLALVGLPPRWLFPRVYGEQPYDWPKTKDICARLKEHISGANFEPATVMDTPQPYDVQNMLKASRFDVLHYVGVGRIGKDKQAQLSMVNKEEGDNIPVDVDTVLKWAAACGVRLVVLEFVMPPDSQVGEPVSPSALGDMLTGSIDAIVYTRFPVHPRQFQTFNQAFYQWLDLGASVEAAVQQGRGVLEQHKPIEDAAGFGWFTVVTGPRSDIRLIRQRARSPQERVTPGTSGVPPAFSAGYQGGSQTQVRNDDFRGV